MCVNIIFKIKYIILFAAILLCGELRSQSLTPSIKLYFGQGDYMIDDYVHLKALDSLIIAMRQDPCRPISKICIECCSSPEGRYARNVELAYLRGESAKIYLVENMGLPDSIITITSANIAWDAPSDQYPQYRYVDIMLSNRALDHVAYPATISYIFKSTPLELIVPLENNNENLAPTPLFALKTNLLFDALTLINLELEVPIRDKWSIAGEFIFPWWTMDNGLASSRRNRIQLLNANLELRRWLGDRSSRPILTGFFAGLYAGGGSYDLEHNAKGYQGEFFIAAGVSGGYAHTINKAQNLRLEYSLGVGYLETPYQYYHAEYCYNSYWHAVEQRSGRYKWFGPTRAKVSLSWLINCKSKNR